jgi:hypothetical protein
MFVKRNEKRTEVPTVPEARPDVKHSTREWKKAHVYI